MTKSIFAAIVGRPNVGKSSLLNKLLGEKVAIVSNKPQTTRNRIMGVLTTGETQYVFIDTPGLHRPKSRLGSFMVSQAESTVSEVELVILVTEWEKPISEIERAFCSNISKRNIPAILVINKIDTLEQKDRLLGKIEQFSSLYNFSAVVPISAKTGDGIKLLMKEIDPFCIEGPHMFDDDTLTDQPERTVIAEIIREKMLYLLHDEIPHGTAVMVDRLHERQTGGIIDIEATIICDKESHKGIIIGAGGAMMKQIATLARLDCEKFFDAKVNLKCWVKVREGWRESDKQMMNFGYRNE